MMYTLLVAAVCATLVPLEGSIVKRATDPCPDDECKGRPMEISIVLDASTSIWPQNFTIAKWFLSNFVGQFDIAQDKVRVSVVTYGDRVYTEDVINFADTADNDELSKAINAIPYPSGSSTQTGAAISYMLDNQISQARKGARKVVIVLTDGNSQQQDVTKAEAERALGAGLEVFAIGVGHDVSEQELHNIASDDEHVFVVDSYHLLDDILGRLSYEACGTPDKNDQCSFEPSDIVFIIDSSVSIKRENFPLGLEFIKEFLDPFTISPTTVRVAAIMFGLGVYEQSAISFDEYSNKKDTVDAILALEWQHATRTDTGLGLQYMLDNFLPNTRPEAAQVAIVITDGKSQEWQKTKDAAKASRDAGFIVFAVGVGTVGDQLDEQELLDIAGDRSRVLTVTDYSKLNTIRFELTHITCHGIHASLQAMHTT